MLRSILPENIRKPRLSDIFKGYRIRTLVENGLILLGTFQCNIRLTAGKFHHDGGPYQIETSPLICRENQ